MIYFYDSGGFQTSFNSFTKAKRGKSNIVSLSKVKIGNSTHSL
jgi:hypothetical protein